MVIEICGCKEQEPFIKKTTSQVSSADFIGKSWFTIIERCCYKCQKPISKKSSKAEAGEGI